VIASPVAPRPLLASAVDVLLLEPHGLPRLDLISIIGTLIPLTLTGVIRIF